MHRFVYALGAVVAAGMTLPLPALAEAPGDPSALIALDAWGLSSIDELGYARVGLMQSDPPRLVVYHVGAADPMKGGDSEMSAPPPMRDGAFFVAPLAGENENNLGGFFNGFARAPARSEVTVEEPGGDDGQRALAFAYDKRPGTFTGFWVHLFDTRSSPADRIYLDARRLEASGPRWLTFEVRGDFGGEPVRLQLADQFWDKKQDSWPIDDVAALVDGGRVDTTWRRAWLALDRLDAEGSRVDRKKLAAVVFLVDPEGQSPRAGRLWVRGLALTEERVAPVAPPAPKPIAGRSEKLAMWLWETQRILESEAELAKLAAFSKARGLTDLFVQIPYGEPRVASQWSERWDEAGMRRLIAALAPVRVHALDGAAMYVRPEWRERLATTVAQIGAFNRAGPERFAGVRFDVEPYLLPEWQGTRREVVLRDYVALLERMRAVTREADLAFGVDIPFWFDGKDEVTGEWAAPLAGRPVIERVLELVDNIGVMDYRTSAYGADGVIAHGSDELALASDKGKEVFVGLETVALPEETLYTFTGAQRTTKLALIVTPVAQGQARITLLRPGATPPPGSRIIGLRETIPVSADKITFCKRGREALEKTMQLARPALSLQPSFAGFVLHSYESLAPWYP